MKLLPFLKKSDDSSHQGEVGELVERSPYYFSPSFMSHSGMYSSVVTLYARVGTNRNLDFDDVIDIIPASTLNGVSITMLIDDHLIKDDEKKRLIKQNATNGKEVIDDTAKNGPKADRDTQSAISTQKAEIEDYDDYELILESAEPIVVYSIRLVLRAPSQELIDEQIELFNISFSKRREGLKWDSLGGDQAEGFERLFLPTERNLNAQTSTGENYSRLNFVVNAGLLDREGVAVGVDIMSLSGSTSSLDFDKSIKTMAMFAAPSSTEMSFYKVNTEGLSQADSLLLNSQKVSVPSIFAQKAANQIVMNGYKAHHFVFNSFDYLDNSKGFLRPNDYNDEIFKKYDVSRVTINPLQGFGDLADVTNVYARLSEKIVNIFDLMQDLKMSAQSRSIMRSAIEKFYLNRQLWITDADLYPQRTRIVNISDPETYPRLSQFIQEFTIMASQAAQENRENKADAVEILKSELSGNLSAHMEILGRPTSIEPSNALQTYYDFSRISTSRIRQIQFLNLLDYVIHQCSPGDVVALHGVDKLYLPTLEFAQDAISAAQEKGIRFIFTFDVMENNESAMKIRNADLFSLKDLYYHDLDADVDLSIIGRCLPHQVDKLSSAMNTELSPTIRASLQSKAQDQVLIHRRVGNVNNFVRAATVI